MKYEKTLTNRWEPVDESPFEEINLERLQKATEAIYSKKNIKNVVLEDMKSSKEIVKRVDWSISNIMERMQDDKMYEGDYWRLQKLMETDLEKLVYKILSVVAIRGQSDTVTSICGIVAPSLDMGIKAALTTVGECILEISKTFLVSLEKNEHTGTWFVKPNFSVDDKVRQFIRKTLYLPPMIVPPTQYRSNRDTPSLTLPKQSLFKGGNKKHHDFPIRLDVLNKLGAVPLALDIDVLKKINPTVPTHNKKTGQALTAEQIQQHEDQIAVGYDVYRMLIRHGNRFYLPSTADNRGRMYAEGYHVSYQGTSFHKAIINLADEEVVQQ